jgi:hypothetical protein
MNNWREGVGRLPAGHHLVHAAPIQVRPGLPIEVVDEGVHLLVRFRPLEAAGFIRDVAIGSRARLCDREAGAVQGR